MSVSRSRRVCMSNGIENCVLLVLRSQKFLGAPQAGAAKRGSRGAPPPSAAQKGEKLKTTGPLLAGPDRGWSQTLRGDSKVVKLKVAFSLILVFRMCTINVDCKDWRLPRTALTVKDWVCPDSVI